MTEIGIAFWGEWKPKHGQYPRVIWYMYKHVESPSNLKELATF